MFVCFFQCDVGIIGGFGVWIDLESCRSYVFHEVLKGGGKGGGRVK